MILVFFPGIIIKIIWRLESFPVEGIRKDVLGNVSLSKSEGRIGSEHVEVGIWIYTKL
jgi:hypothetical protein